MIDFKGFGLEYNESAGDQVMDQDNAQPTVNR